MPAPTPAPPYLRVNARDNVAMVVDQAGLKAGTELPDGLKLWEDIPQAHKIALRDVERGEPVIRYGQTIAFASRRIKAGSWVREEMLEVPPPPRLDQLGLATSTPAPETPLPGFTFEGFKNADGSVGTKNILGITTTVQ